MASDADYRDSPHGETDLRGVSAGDRARQHRTRHGVKQQPPTLLEFIGPFIAREVSHGREQTLPDSRVVRWRHPSTGRAKAQVTEHPLQPVESFALPHHLL